MRLGLIGVTGHHIHKLSYILLALLLFKQYPGRSDTPAFKDQTWLQGLTKPVGSRSCSVFAWGSKLCGGSKWTTAASLQRHKTLSVSWYLGECKAAPLQKFWRHCLWKMGHTMPQHTILRYDTPGVCVAGEGERDVVPTLRRC